MTVNLLKKLFESYTVEDKLYDEAFENADKMRQQFLQTLDHFKNLSLEDVLEIHEYTKLSFYNQGITFNVYTDKEQGAERIFPFDFFPRIIMHEEWEKVENGVIQRTKAINAFLTDLYGKQLILKDKVVPRELINSSKQFLKELKGVHPIGNIYTHISGTDIVRNNDGDFYVLEDNVRCPSGISYVLANRVAIKKTFADLLSSLNVQPVDIYPDKLLETMQSMAPEGVDEPNCVVLTPGMYNSAFFEHSFLASQMGIDLVEGSDLFVENGFVYMKTTKGPERVDVIYRRVDDEFIDPKVFRKDSLLGVSGIIEAYSKGNVALINAPGTGVSDDKAVYAYMPQIIKYYLDEEPILNNVETYHCLNPEHRKYVLENMENLVVKPVDESGGYGVMIGSKSTKKERADYKKVIEKNPRKYIAQPILSLSVLATFIEDEKKFEPRHMDLRTFSLTGKDETYVCKGGLTRVALRKGSLVVNSSQGGGSKDTWVVT